MLGTLLAATLLGCNDRNNNTSSSSAASPPATATSGTGNFNGVTVSVLYGSEKKDWLEAVTQSFNAQGLKTADGQPVQVTLKPMGSAEAVDRILDGSEQPVVYSPASRLLLPVLNARWRKTHEQKLTGDALPLVLSPVVIAMWQPMAKALGYPQKPLGWADIAKLASQQTPWSQYGYPQWGRFQFGHTHPDYSNSGIAAILAASYAASGKTAGLTLADLENPKVGTALGNLERGIIHYGESTGFFANQMIERGPGYLSAAVLYENLIVNANRGGKLGTKLTAIYPKEGTFWSDHPFAVLNAPWVSKAQRQGAEVYRQFLMADAQQRRALEFGFRPAGNVPTGDPIGAANGANPQEPRKLLEVPGVEIINRVRALWGKYKKRVAVSVILDTSGSMQNQNRLETAKAALAIFVKQLSDEDAVGVTVFNSAQSQLSPLTPLKNKRQRLLDDISSLFPSGGTRLYDTLLEVYRAAQKNDTERIRAVVLLTDGEDTDSNTSLEAVQAALGGDESGNAVKVFTIAYGDSANTEALKSLSAATGAKSYSSDPSNLAQVYKDIGTFF